MAEPQKSAPRSRTATLAVGAIGLVAVAGLLAVFTSYRSGPPEGDAAIRAPEPARPEAEGAAGTTDRSADTIARADANRASAPGSAAPAAPPPTDLPPGPILASGETLEITAASLVEGESWTLNLDLELPSPSDEPLRGRVLAMDDGARTPLPIEAAIAGEQRRHATLTLPGYWLTPGRYLIEVRTHERSHLPLRRYVVEVR